MARTQKTQKNTASAAASAQAPAPASTSAPAPAPAPATDFAAMQAQIAAMAEQFERAIHALAKQSVQSAAQPTAQPPLTASIASNPAAVAELAQFSGPQPTPGISFFDAKQAPFIILQSDDRATKGQEVRVQGKSGKLYGPYILDRIIAQGNGHATWIAYRVEKPAAAKSIDQMTKAELVQMVAQLAAQGK